DSLAQEGDVVAERLAKSSRIQEIALHVDENRRAAVELEGDRLGDGVERKPWASHRRELHGKGGPFGAWPEGREEGISRRASRRTGSRSRARGSPPGSGPRAGNPGD